VAKVSFWQQQLLYFIPKTSRAKGKRRAFNSVSVRQLRRSSPGLIGAIALTAMLFWNWKLLLAMAVGVGMMLGVYRLQGANWPAYWSRLQHFFNSTHRQLVVAVGTGGISAVLTYIAATVWANTENRWLAVGAIFQGFATLLTLMLLSWQIAGRHLRGDEETFEQFVADLTHSDLLKRLIAVRRLTQLLHRGQLNGSDRLQLAEYFRVMLSRESELPLRNALIEGLQVFDDLQNQEQPSPVLQMPLKLKRSPSQVHQFR